jgi:hypothetical protein
MKAATLISMVSDVLDTATRSVQADKIIRSISLLIEQWCARIETKHELAKWNGGNR